MRWRNRQYCRVRLPVEKEAWVYGRYYGWNDVAREPVFQVSPTFWLKAQYAREVEDASEEDPLGYDASRVKVEGVNLAEHLKWFREKERVQDGKS